MSDTSRMNGDESSHSGTAAVSRDHFTSASLSVNTDVPDPSCPSSSVSSGQDADTQSLLCAESKLSSPADDRHLSATDPDIWKHEINKSPLHYTSSLGQDIVYKDKILSNSINNNNNNTKTPAYQQVQPAGAICEHKQNSSNSSADRGNGTSLDRRMSTNGLERSGMTGSSNTTSENLSWLPEVAVCQSSQSQRSASGILTSIAGGQDPHLMIPSAVAGSGSLFRPPLTDPQSRLFPSGQYAPIYTTTGTSLSHYSASMYPHVASGQSSQLSLTQYGVYPQYPIGYNPETMLSSPYPAMGSYSALLSTMGSQLQHAQSQLPRSPYLQGPMPPYGPAIAQQTNSPPGPNLNRPLTPSQGLGPGPAHLLPTDLHRRESKSPKMEQSDRSARQQAKNLSPLREGKGHGYSPSSHMKPTAGMGFKDMSPQESSGRESGYKTVSSKDSARKNIILTRASESQMDVPMYSESRHLTSQGHMRQSPHHHHHHHHHHHPMHHTPRGDEPTQKRLKLPDIGNPPPLHPSQAPQGSQAHPPNHQGSQQLPPPPPLHPANYPLAQPHFPPHFMKGSIIQLANGELKRVEELRTDDFVHSADISEDLKIDSSQVVRIDENYDRGTAYLSFSVGEHRVQVTVEATLEHPFFVFGQGWSSCDPERTLQRYGLSCQKLSVGDVCISLTHKDLNARHIELHRQSHDHPSSHDRSSNVRTSHDRFSISESVAATRAPSYKAAQPVTLPPGGAGDTTDRDSSVSHSRRQLKTPPSREHLPAESVGSTASSAGVTPPGVSPRKRRWSAPDQLSSESSSRNDIKEDAATSAVKAERSDHT